MKTLICITLLCITTLAFANNPTKIGFRAYSSQTGTTCTVFGMGGELARDDNQIIMQGFAPQPAYSRTFALGTKGMSNYSTNRVRGVKFTCVTTGTSTASPTKVFMSGVETYFLTLSSDTLYVGQ